MGTLRINTQMSVTSTAGVNASLKKDTRSTQTGEGSWTGVQNIGISEEVLSLAGVSAPRALQLINLDDENYVDWGPEVTGAMEEVGRLYPGESSVITLFPSVVIRMKANTAAVDVAYMLAET